MLIDIDRRPTVSVEAEPRHPNLNQCVGRDRIPMSG